MSKFLLILAMVGGLVGLGVWKGIFRAKALPDLSLMIEPKPFEEVIEAEGHIDAQSYHDVFAPYCRYERRVIFLVEEGTTVKPGDLLAQFDPGAISLAIEDLEDRIRSFDQASADIRFRSKAETYEQQVRADTAQQGVVLSGIRKEISQFESSLRKSTVEVELNNQIKWATSAKDQRKRLDWRDTVTDRNRAIQRDYYEQKVKDLKEDAEQLNLYSEYEGVVLYPPIPLQGDLRKVQTGDYLERGQLFLRIPEPGVAIIRFHLEEAQINRLRERMELTFTTAAYPGELYRGRVLSIAHFSEPASFLQNRRLYEVLARVELKDQQPPLKIGMVARTRFLLHRYNRVYAFPKEWVKPEADGIRVVFYEGQVRRSLVVRNAIETEDYYLAESLPEINGAIRLVMATDHKERLP